MGNDARLGHGYEIGTYPKIADRANGRNRLLTGAGIKRTIIPLYLDLKRAPASTAGRSAPMRRDLNGSASFLRSLYLVNAKFAFDPDPHAIYAIMSGGRIEFGFANGS